MADVLWICATGDHPVGIVKIYDEIEQRWKYYIGTGDGRDLDADVRKILVMGQKFYSLDHIMDFWEADVEKVVRCKDCKHGIWDEENEMWKCVESAEYDENTGEWFGFYEYHNEDFYCAHGERREHGQT